MCCIDRLISQPIADFKKTPPQGRGFFSTKHPEERRRAEALRLMVLGLENRTYWLALFAFTRPWLKRLSAPFLPMSSAVFLSNVLS